MYFPIQLDKPGPVSNLAVTEVTEKSISLKWEEPEDDGGCPITDYVIEKREASKRKWSPAGETKDELVFTDNTVTKGNQYVFRVAATNEIGTGEFKELTQPVTAKSQFGELHNTIILPLYISYLYTKPSFSQYGFVDN